jgi:hypothetical protein
MDHIEEGKHQAAELRFLAGTVAGLIGYTLDPPADNTSYRAAVRLHGLLRDTENHDGRGVHDADDDPGEPDGPIGDVSPIIGKVPGTPGRFALHDGPRALRVGGS